MSILNWDSLRSLYSTVGRSGNSASRRTQLADASAGGAGVACWLRQVKLDFAAHTTLDRAPVAPAALRSLRLTHTRDWVLAVAGKGGVGSGRGEDLKRMISPRTDCPGAWLSLIAGWP